MDKQDIIVSVHKFSEYKALDKDKSLLKPQLIKRVETAFVKKVEAKYHNILENNQDVKKDIETKNTRPKTAKVARERKPRESRAVDEE